MGNIKEYTIAFTTEVIVYVNVEAESLEEAVEEACSEVYLNNYCGNGGCDKLVGVCAENMSIETSGEMTYDEFLTLDANEIE